MGGEYILKTFRSRDTPRWSACAHSPGPNIWRLSVVSPSTRKVIFFLFFKVRKNVDGDLYAAEGFRPKRNGKPEMYNSCATDYISMAYVCVVVVAVVVVAR